MSVLDVISDWPVDTVAIGVTDQVDTLGTAGPTGTVQRIASVTKALAAYATLVAVQDGVVHLDEPAGPEGSTLRHLLSHASGLGPSEGTPTSPVAKRRIYSNLGFELLGRLVEERVGTSFAEHLDVEVLAPLGMTSTVLDGSPAHAARSTVDDLLAFARELLSPTLVDVALLAEATSVQFPGLTGILPGYGRQDPNDWGLGFELRDHKDPHWTGAGHSPQTFGHFGQTGSFLWVDPQAGLAAATLADRDFSDWAVEVWPPINDAILDAYEPRA